MKQTPTKDKYCSDILLNPGIQLSQIPLIFPMNHRHYFLIILTGNIFSSWSNEERYALIWALSLMVISKLTLNASFNSHFRSIFQSFPFLWSNHDKSYMSFILELSQLLPRKVSPNRSPFPPTSWIYSPYFPYFS